MPNRRDMLRLTAGAGVVAAAAALTPRLDAIIGCGPTDGPQAEANGKKIKPGCPGNCADQGMVGMYPRCYYPQYGYINTSLAQAQQAAMIQFAQAAMNNAVTPAMISNLKTMNTSWINHLFNNRITAGFGQQLVDQIQGNSVTGDQLTYVNSLAQNANLPANFFQQPLYSGSPLGPYLQQGGSPSMTDIVNNLPIGNWDAINALTNQRIQSITYQGPGNPCGFTDPQGTQNGADFSMAAGVILNGLALLIGGPIGELVAIAADVFAYGGAGFTLVVHVCEAIE